MRKLIITLVAALLTLVIFTNSSLISVGAERIAERLLLYVHIAQLYTEEPDSTISMPLKEVRKKQIADSWHAPRSGNRLHEGQDLFAPRDTPVYSATEGYVLQIGENDLGGKTVSVIGAGGRVYYYAHLDSYAEGLREADDVTPQTILGYVGTTGNAQGTPPHLHLGVYTPTGAINPLPLLKDRRD